MTAAQVAAQVGGTVQGDDSVLLTGCASAEHAGDGDLTFAEKDSYFASAEQSEASAILVSGEFTSVSKVLIVVPDARVALARILLVFFPTDGAPHGIHPSAVISDSAQLGPNVHIGPNCVVGENVTIGAGCVLHGGNHIGRDCTLADEVVLHPNVVLYPRTRIGNRVTIHAGSVIGSDGYGYVFDEGRHLKIQQVGYVQVDDDVEIGANSAIDRGALGPTVIGQGTKIDNLVHVAHNVSFGRHNLIMGQCGFAGSTTLGDYCVIASQSGVAGHLSIGPQATVGAKSGVMWDIPAKGTVLGVPAQPDRVMKRQLIALQKLPELMKRVRDLEKKLAECEPESSG